MDQEELKKKIKQFGKKGKWIGLGIIGAIVIAVLIKGGMYTVREQEQAVIRHLEFQKLLRSQVCILKFH